MLCSSIFLAKTTSQKYIFQVFHPHKFCLQLQTLWKGVGTNEMVELSSIIIINEVRCADTSFHSICRQWRHYNFRNMIAISRFLKCFLLASLHFPPSFFCVELCWIAFETLQTETGKKLKRNCSCSIQFSFLKLSEKLRTLKTLYVEELLIFLSHKKERKKLRVHTSVFETFSSSAFIYNFPHQMLSS